MRDKKERKRIRLFGTSVNGVFDGVSKEDVEELLDIADERDELAAKLERELQAAEHDISDSSVTVAMLEGHIQGLERKLKIAELKNASSLANNLCLDHRDKQQGKGCLACEIEKLEKKLARADSMIIWHQKELEEIGRDGQDSENETRK